MIIRFSVENFLSFNKRQIFSLIPGRGVLKSTHKSIPVHGVATLKASVIFGANASGKSNLIRAIEFGKNMVLKGNRADQPIVYKSFRLDESNLGKTSRLEYEIQHKGTNYAYGFVFDSKEIKEEWLYLISKKGEKKIFDRTSTVVYDLSYFTAINTSDEAQFLEYTAKATPRNQLFLTNIRNTNMTDNVRNVNDLFNIIDWFQNALTIIYPNSKNIGKKFELLEDTNLQQLFSEMLEYFDTGIDGISFDEIEFDKIDVPDEIKEEIKLELLNKNTEKKGSFISNPRDDEYYVITRGENLSLDAKILKTKHNVEGGTYELFDLKDESDGTRRIMDLIPLIVDFIKGDNVFVIDELERSLHPNLIYDLFDFLLSHCENVNSQLIVASHESSLLTQKLLRKDEIWFVVKDKMGASNLHSLEDYNIRFDKEVRRDYLLGRYKAVPRLGNRANLTVLPSPNKPN